MEDKGRRGAGMRLIISVLLLVYGAILVVSAMPVMVSAFGFIMANSANIGAYFQQIGYYLLIAGVASLLPGIFGIRNYRRPGRRNIFIAIGIVMIFVAVVLFIWMVMLNPSNSFEMIQAERLMVISNSLVFNAASNAILTLFPGIVLPILYLIAGLRMGK